MWESSNFITQRWVKRKLPISPSSYRSISLNASLIYEFSNPICHGEVFCLKAKKYRYNHKIMPRQFTKRIFSFNTKTVNFLKIKILIYNLYGSIGVLKLYFLKIKVPFLLSYNISERNLPVMRSVLVHMWRLDTA